MKKTIILFLSFFLLIHIATSAQDSLNNDAFVAPKTDLSLQLVEGKAYPYKSTFEQRIEQQFIGDALTIEQTITSDITLQVEQAQAEGIQLKATYTRLQIHSNRSVTPYHYDSDARDADNPLAALDQVIGRSFWIDLSPQGALRQLRGWDAIAQSFSSIEAFTDFDETLLRFLFDASLHLFHDAPVAVGQSWTHTYALPLPNHTTKSIQAEYTLEGLSEDLAWLGIQSPMNADNLQESIQGTYEVNRHTGLVSYGDVQYTVQWDADTDQNASSPVKVAIQHTLEIQP